MKQRGRISMKPEGWAGLDGATNPDRYAECIGMWVNRLAPGGLLSDTLRPTPN